MSAARVDAAGVPAGGKIGLLAKAPCSSCGTPMRRVKSTTVPVGKVVAIVMPTKFVVSPVSTRV